MNKLIGMTDLILSDEWDGLDESNFIMIIEYAKFLKQKNELWMFVPCDKEGNVMKEPCMVFSDDNEECDNYIKLFCEAKERCLFEVYSFEDDTENYWYFGLDEFKLIGVEKSDTIESLTTYEIKLTPTAQKQLGWT